MKTTASKDGPATYYDKEEQTQRVTAAYEKWERVGTVWSAAAPKVCGSILTKLNAEDWRPRTIADQTLFSKMKSCRLTSTSSPMSRMAAWHGPTKSIPRMVAVSKPYTKAGQHLCTPSPAALQ